MKNLLNIVAISLVLLISACGGSGGDGTTISDTIKVSKIIGDGSPNTAIELALPVTILKSDTENYIQINVYGDMIYVTETETEYIVSNTKSNSDIASGDGIALKPDNVVVFDDGLEDVVDPVDETDEGTPSGGSSGKLITYTVVGQDPLLIDLPAYVFKTNLNFTYKFDSDSSMFIIDDGDRYTIQFGTGGLASGTHVEIAGGVISGE